MPPTAASQALAAAICSVKIPRRMRPMSNRQLALLTPRATAMWPGSGRFSPPLSAGECCSNACRRHRPTTSSRDLGENHTVLARPATAVAVAGALSRRLAAMMPDRRCLAKTLSGCPQRLDYSSCVTDRRREARSAGRKQVSVEHFRRRADECRHLASVARNASDRAFWLGLVERWQALEVQKVQQPARDKSRSPFRRRSEPTQDIGAQESPTAAG